MKNIIRIIAIALATAFGSAKAQSALGHWSDIEGNQLIIESGKKSLQVIEHRGDHNYQRTANVDGNTIVYYKNVTMTLKNSPNPSNPITKEAQIKVVYSLTDDNTLHEAEFLCVGNSNNWAPGRNHDWKRISQ